MGNYKNILVAVDLPQNCALVLQRASEMANCQQAALELLHVIEYVPIEPMGEALLPSVQIEDELARGAKRQLDALGEAFDIPAQRRTIRIGNIKTEIVAFAQEQGSDLIILGCRERHGLAILVNLTEDTVLHAAPCDVLAVRLDN